jgi:hypothetical protein
MQSTLRFQHHLSVCQKKGTWYIFESPQKICTWHQFLLTLEKGDCPLFF